MKKRIAIMLTAITMASTVLAGCSLSKENLNIADEFVNDETENKENSEDAESTGDYASSDTSKIVVNNLFEPLLEEVSATASTSTIQADSSKKKDEEAKDETEEDDKDKVKMVFFGDSQFDNGRNDGTDLATLVSKQVPDSVAYNLGIGGSTAAISYTTTAINPEVLRSTSFIGMVYCLAGTSDRNETLEDHPEVLSEMNKIDPKEVDYYFIEYGANDFFEDNDLDRDMSNHDQLHSYYGALREGINILEDISPDAQIILVSPFYGIYTNPDGTFIGDSYVISNGFATLADYAKKCRNVSEDKETYFLDTMFMSKTDLYLDTASDYLMDGLHLSLKGRQIFARLMAHYPNYLEKNEPFAYLDSDFIKISEFDPDEYYKLDEDIMKHTYPESYEKYMNGVFRLAKPDND
ncbi:MAG: SGNH/GDSL hydrolase family protein [Butyrivibrio sp.]|nr:SGNH/GDSL hydrolase family protein [Butyrivibrio sp.]